MKTPIDFMTLVFLFPLSEMSTGLLTFALFGHKDNADAKVLAALSTDGRTVDRFICILIQNGLI